MYKPTASSSSSQPLLATGDEDAKNGGNVEKRLQEASVVQVSVADAPPPFAPQGRVEDHVLEPNATDLPQIVQLINRNGSSSSMANALCCVTGMFGCWHLLSGRIFTTQTGRIDLWLDANKRPHAYAPNEWHIVANLMHSHLGTYDMASAEPYQQSGVCITKVEAGRVIFANRGGQPIMIAAKDNKTGWYVSTEAGFSFADKIRINNQQVNTNAANISEDYISFESLHLFNVQPNTICVVSKPASDGMKSEFAILMPGPHSYNSPYMRFLATIPTSVQDVIITEATISTQDGVVLSNCSAVLSYRVKMDEAQNLLLLDVRNYNSVISDWAKRTMLHEIGNTNYQGYRKAKYENSSDGDVDRHHVSVLGPHAEEIAEEGAPFRPTLEHKMQEALKNKLSHYGVEVVAFSLQSFEPPKVIADQVTAALAKRAEAYYGLQAQQVNNQTAIAKAEAEAKAINIEAEAIAAAAKKMEQSPYAQRLKLADQQAKIAKAWTSGSARTLLFGAPTASGVLSARFADDVDQAPLEPNRPYV